MFKRISIAALCVSASLMTLAQNQAPASYKLASGVKIQTMTEGTGARPKPTDSVTVHYEGTLPGGQVFDSSRQRGQPATFKLPQVIPCWTIGLTQMAVGGTMLLTCPANTAYGDQGVPGVIPPNTVLKFEVTLILIQSPE